MTINLDHPYGSIAEIIPEATWGADPLEFLGGFSSLDYNINDTYPSSLGRYGLVGWSIQSHQSTFTTEAVAESSLSFSFPDVDWPFLQTVYGWTSSQYQAWSRGKFVITGDESRNVVIYADGILELCLDGVSYFGGDFYTYRRAPLTVSISPGLHTLELRLIRDVRAMGGTSTPMISATVRIELSTVRLKVVDEKILMPEMVIGRGLAGSYGAVPIRNESTDWLEIQSIDSMNVSIIN